MAMPKRTHYITEKVLNLFSSTFFIEKETIYVPKCEYSYKEVNDKMIDK